MPRLSTGHAVAENWDRECGPHTAMHQVFGRTANAILAGAVVLITAVVGTVAALPIVIDRAGFNQRRGETISQPIEFSHQRHSHGLGIDCRYCHGGVERSSFAGMPSTETCLHCHRQVRSDSEKLNLLRKSWNSGIPLAWNRIHDLPDFVAFDHSIHSAKGVGCVSCHGRIDQMTATKSEMPHQMSWCLACHRNPRPVIRPREQITKMERVNQGAGPGNPELRDALALTSCSTCHR